MKTSIAFLLILLMAPLAAAETTQNPHGKLSWDCLDCHNTTSWTSFKEPMAFKHDKTGFPLVGRHAAVTCGNCHKDLQFSMIGTACADCHTDIHRAQFGNDCENCHTPKNWNNNKEILSLHAARGFPLLGVHTVADCGACHMGQQMSEYADTPMDCQGCHSSNFTATTNPNHIQAGFSSDCGHCHAAATTSWSGGTYPEHPAAFPLHGGHAKIGCNACHAQGYTNTDADCYHCHTDVFNSANNPSHVTFGFPTTCAACHNDVSWNQAQFDHMQASNFALEGAHITILCTACHVNNQLTGLSRDCYGCHQQNFNTATNPNHIQGNYPQTCLTCHNQNAWSPATFNHATSRFPLTGAHASLQCAACHAAGYQNTPFDCYSCHQANFNGASSPNHVQNNFDHNCAVCHSTSAWQPATFDHSTTTFPLTGAHASVQCVSCHANGYQNTPTDCYSCHQNNFNGASNPSHTQNNFDHNCTICHNTAAWQPSTFNHNNTTFPLTGAHTSLQCAACHANGYNNTPADCYSCHANDYNNAQGHVANNFSHDCTQCHNTSGWGNGVFNHANSAFPLTGAHSSLQCIACHQNGYQNTPIDCYSCHQTKYAGVIDPNHVQNNFDHNCAICHTATAWNPATFDHSATPFPLTGAHAAVQCQSCHAGGYQNTPADCYSCHQSSYIGVADPNHVQNNFSHDCTQCHNNNAWTPASFDHAGTRFPLTGAHISLQCAACHAAGYQNTPFDCYSCHQTDFSGAASPSHTQNNFDHNCTICHNTSAWQPSTFDHGTTGFPLTGAHIPLECISCHASGYQNTPAACYSCHQGNYTGVADPNHVADNFSQDCTQCHTTSNWTQVTFNHSITPFPLTGAHVNVQCAACHAGGYDNTSTDCYACHATDYNGTANPNHQSAQFPTTCATCHNTSAWIPSTWNHDALYFPIYSGNHQGRWTTCADCHVNTGNYLVFECIFCHTHNQLNTDSQHQGVSGYQYVSQACYSCHPTGGGGGR